jgi:WD40 repeat protein
MNKIFMSYARGDDEAFARHLYEDLTKAGFDVWFDRISMPSRQLTFLQEIRDAIATCDRLLLVVGPKAMVSDYVKQEWQFAYFAANKCVNPVVRLDGVDSAGHPMDAYSLIPEDLRLLHIEDFRDDHAYSAHLGNLVRQLSEDLPPLGSLVAVPELPCNYRAHPQRLKALRDLILPDLYKPVVVTGAGALVGLQGMGGIGKSVLASALAHHPEVRRAFKDGVFWIALGQTPRVVDHQRWLTRQLGGDDHFNDERSGKERLRELLAKRTTLLILDDLWQRDHAEEFNVVGPRGRLLLTTRDIGLVTALAAPENHYQVQLPDLADAVAILASSAYVDPTILPPEAQTVVAECGRLPLALALCGGMVQGGTSWSDVIEALREHDLAFLSSDHPPEEHHRSAWKAMDISLRVLPEDQCDRFAELAVFRMDADTPDSAVATLWEYTAGLSTRDARQLLASLARRSLVQQVGACVKLHDLLHNFAEGIVSKRFGSRAALNRMLLDAYRTKCADGWSTGPNDGYFYQNLCGHLLAAGEMDDVVGLLTGLQWVEAKCRAGLVFGLQSDYHDAITALPEAQVALQQQQAHEARAARWTAEIIEHAHKLSGGERPALPEVIPSAMPWTNEQIQAACQRINDSPTRLDRLQAFMGFSESECYRLLEYGTRSGFVVQHAFNQIPGGPVHDAAARLTGSAGVPLLLRRWPPNTANNPKPALLCTMEGHKDHVWSVSVTPDGRCVVSGSGDNTLRVWNLQSGQCLRTLEGHKHDVKSVSVTPDGRLAVSGGADHALRIWDLERGQCLRTLEGHKHDVESVSVTPDGRLAVSGGGVLDATLRVWELHTGRCMQILEGHNGGVWSVSVTPNGQRAVSGCNDANLRVWNLCSGRCQRTLQGHGLSIQGVSMTDDGRLAVSASCDKTLRVWDLDSGQCLRALEGHSDHIWSVSFTPDGRRAVSGSGDHTLRVWDVESGQCLREPESDNHEVTSTSLSADGRRAVSAGWQTLRIWNAESGQCLRTLEAHSGWVGAVSMMPDGRHAVSGNGGAFERETTLRVWDVESGQCLHTMTSKNGRGSRSLSVTPDERYALSLDGYPSYELWVWDLVGGRCLHTLELLGSATSVSVTPDARRAVTSSLDATLRVWELHTGRCMQILESHDGGVWSVDMTSDGRRAVTTGSDGTVRVWELDSGQCLSVLKGHSAWVVHVGVTPDGKRAVSASEDRTLRVWDLDAAQCLGVYCAPAQIHSLALSSRGNRICIGLNTGEVLFLDIQDVEPGPCLEPDLAQEEVRNLGLSQSLKWLFRIVPLHLNRSLSALYRLLHQR